MRRNFSKLQRRVLAFKAGGKCQICGGQLNNDFHADHIKPYSKLGKTITQNGQALCKKCNLQKGATWN